MRNKVDKLQKAQADIDACESQYRNNRSPFLYKKCMDAKRKLTALQAEKQKASGGVTQAQLFN